LGKFEKLQTDILRWRVQYKDGSILWEVEPKTHLEKTYKDIDVPKMKSIDLLFPVGQMEDVLASDTDVQIKLDNPDEQLGIASLKVYNRKVQPFYHMEMPPNAKLILVRRNQRTQGRKVATFTIKKRQIKIPFPVPAGGKIIIIGWEQKIGDKTFKSLNYIFPDGHIEHDFRWGDTEAEHNEAEIPNQEFTSPELTEATGFVTDANVEKPSSAQSMETDAIIEENKSSSTTKVGTKAEPRPGIPDDVMN